MATRMQQRRGTYNQWHDYNPILNAGEMGWESDNNKFKIGDGVNHWNDLPYFKDENALGASLEDYIPLTALGAANGVAQLNSSGKLVSSQIPNIDEITQDAIDSALVAGNGITKSYDDPANTITLAVDTSVVATKAELAEAARDAVGSALTSGNGITIVADDNADTITVAVDTSVIATKAELAEVSQDSVNDALIAGTGLDKTYDDANNTITLDIDSTVTTNSGTQTLTNKTINLTSNTLSGTKAQFNAAMSDADFATIAGTETLTNKTLTSPTINSPSGITKSDVGLANVDNTSDANKPVSSATQTALDAKAPLASPVLTGTPTAPTATAGTNNTQVATTAYVDTAVAGVVDSAPSTLNTLNELAVALGNDENFATTTATAIGNKVAKAGDTMTGALTLSGAPTTNLHAATKKYVDDTASAAQSAAESTAASALSSHEADTTNIHGIADTSALATKTYADSAVSTHAAVTTSVHGISDTSKLVTTDDSGTVTSTMIANGTIVNADINASAAIDWTKLAVSSTVSATELGYVDGVTSAIQTQLDAKLASATAASTYAPIASPTFTGTVSGVTKSMVGLGNVDNTSDANKPVSTATQSALDLKAPLASPTFTGTVTLPTGTVTSGMILDGTIVNSDISSSAAIALSKLATDPLARANHTGTQTASTISDFDTQVRTSKVTDLAAPTSAFSMNSNKITNVSTPTSDNDAANKSYVDAAVNNINIHESVVAATTANVNLTNAVDNNKVLDGVTLSTGNRILVKNQNTASQNGIYIVAANGAPTRATDYDAAGEVSAGDFIFVTGGTVNGSTGWIQTAVVTTVGTDSLAFTQFSGAGTYTASTGLSLSGTAFSIDSTVATLTGTQTLTNKTLTSPTLTAPVLGTPASGTLTNATGLPISTGVSGLGTGVATFLATPTSANLASAITDETGSGALVFATSPTLVTPTLGVATATSVNGTTIPTSKTLVVTTDKLSALAATTSLELAGVISDETGSGSLVFATSPTLVTPVLGTPTSVTLTNATGLPLSTGVTGTLPIANGGTGQTTASAAANALLPTQSSNSGKYLTTDGTNLSWGTVSGYSAPTLGSTSIASGATVTSIVGLTNIRSVAHTSVDANGYEQDLALMNIMSAW